MHFTVTLKHYQTPWQIHHCAYGSEFFILPCTLTNISLYFWYWFWIITKHSERNTIAQLAVTLKQYRTSWQIHHCAFCPEFETLSFALTNTSLRFSLWICRNNYQCDILLQRLLPIHLIYVISIILFIFGYGMVKWHTWRKGNCVEEFCEENWRKEVTGKNWA